MSERHYEPLSDYEARLGRRLLAASEDVVWPVDAAEVARGAAKSGHRGAPWAALQWTWRPSLALLLLVLALALIGGAIFVGSRLLLNDPLTDRLGHLAYTLDGNLWIAESDGSDPVRVAADVEVNSLQWSRDGSTLSFFGNRPGSEETILYQSDGDGQGVREIARSADGLSAIGPVSPSGEYRAGRRSELPADLLFPRVNYLTIMDQAGNSVDVRTPAGYVNWMYWEPVVWAPDSETIFAGTCTTQNCKGGRGSVFRVPRTGGTPLRLTPEEMVAWPSSVSPDGSTVAFSALGTAEAGGPTFELGVVGADGTDLRMLADFSEGIDRIVWTPDGKGVAVAGLHNDESGVWILDPAGSSEPRLLVDTAQAVNAISFSPDGRWLLTHWATEADSGLWRVEVDGTIRDELVAGAIEGDWQWLPNGETE